MGAPVKPLSKRVTMVRGTFYLPYDLAARLDAEIARTGTASRTDMIRRLLHRHLPRDTQVSLSIGPDDL